MSAREGLVSPQVQGEHSTNPMSDLQLELAMKRKFMVATLLAGLVFLSGCASVPMASMEEDRLRKEFSPPPEGMAGLYIYRNTNMGGALKKTIKVDGEVLGESGPMTYFYIDVTPGSHTLSTESEFSDNDLVITTEAGHNYFVHQHIKLGVFVGGAKFELVSAEEGKEGVLECELAK